MIRNLSKSSGKIYVCILTFLFITNVFNSYGECLPYSIPVFPTMESYTNIRYIDPGSPSNGNGSISNPYNTLQGLTLQENTAYLLKRGTTLNERINKVLKRVYIGAYGEGEKPIITMGFWIRAGSSDVVIDGLEIRRTTSGGFVTHNSVVVGDDSEIPNLYIVNNLITGIYSSTPDGVDILGLPIHYPIRGIRLRGNNLVIYNNIITNVHDDGIWLSSTPNLQIVRNWIYNINRGGFNEATGTWHNLGGDCIQLEYSYRNAYIAGNRLDKTNTAWKFSFIINSGWDNTHQNIIIEHNTFLGSRSGSGGSVVYFNAPKNTIFRYNVVDATNMGRHQGGVVNMAITNNPIGHLTQNEPFGIRSNHLIKMTNSDAYTYPNRDIYLDPSNIRHNGFSQFTNYKENNPDNNWGSDIDINNFWAVPNCSQRSNVNFSIIDLQNQPIDNAQISLGQVTNNQGDYNFFDVLNGIHSFQIQAENFRTKEGSININSDSTYTIRLAPIENEVLEIEFNIANNEGNKIDNATVIFDEKENPPGNYVFQEILPGEYSYTIIADGYQTINVSSFHVSKNTSIDILLLPKSYSIQLATMPVHGGTTSGNGSYDHGSNIVITATPAEGYSFVNWTENGTFVSNQISYSFIVSKDRNLQANFSENGIEISINASPSSGGTVSGSGTYGFGQTVNISASPVAGYSFLNWTENGIVVSLVQNYSFTANNNRNLTANFVINNYNINTGSNPANAGTTTGSGVYTYGQTINLTANPNNGYLFNNWTENNAVISTQPSFSFPANANRNIIANFTRIQFTVTVAAGPHNGGSVSGAGTFPMGNIIEVSAQEEPGFTFINWTEGNEIVSTLQTYSFSLTENRNLRANFEPIAITVSATPIPESAGIVNGNGLYNYSQVVTLSAIATDGYTFLNWTDNGDVISLQPDLSFTAVENRSLVANFTQSGYEISLTASPSVGGTVSGAGLYSLGQTAILSAYPETGYSFTNWTENGNVVSSQPNMTFVVTQSRDLTANFIINNYNIFTAPNPLQGGMVSGGGNYNYGQTITLNANANTGYTFINWTENDIIISTLAEMSFVSDANRNMIANFIQLQYNLEIESNLINGGSFQGEGIYFHGQSIEVSAIPAMGYDFVNWTEGSTIISNEAVFSLIITDNRSIRANFAPQTFSISSNSLPASGGIISGNGIYSFDQTVNLVADPNPEFRFLHWTENGQIISDQSNISFAADKNRILTAHFERIRHMLTLIASPSEGGSVTESGSHSINDVVHLDATPNDGYIFKYWSVNGNAVSFEPSFNHIITQNETLVAHFEIFDPYINISTIVWPSGYGFVTGSGIYSTGQDVQLVAYTLDNNFVFLGWFENGELIHDNQPMSFIADKSREIYAMFELNNTSYQVSAKASDVEFEEVVEIFGEGEYKLMEVAVLEAQIPDNVVFIGWINSAGQIVSRQNPFVFEVNRNIELLAKMEFVVQDKPEIILYPNPNNGVFTINRDDIEFIQVFNTNGIMVQERRIVNPYQPINLRELPLGIYLVKFYSGGEFNTVRFIKK